MEPRAWQAGWILAGRYQLQERIGRGGMGSVYRARDLRLDRPVAIKVLFEHVAQEPVARQRLEREARAAASLVSPHVVQVFDVGIDGDRPYLVMEYLDGGTLAEHLAGRLPLPTASIVEYGRQIAAGLAAAHARGLIHRDITLRNVLVTAEGRLKIADFGLTKIHGGANLTQSGLAMGTPVAMAPEQAQGQPVTPATDVYALGVLLYQLATGRPPFIGDDDIAIVLQHMQAAPTPPRQLNRALPAWLEAVILRALAKDPADRYPDGAALEAALASGPSGLAAPIGELATTATRPRSTPWRLHQLAAARREALGATTPGDTVALRRLPYSPLRPAWLAAPRRRLGLLLGGLTLALLIGLLAATRGDGGGPAAPRATPPPTTPAGQVGGGIGAVGTATPTAPATAVSQTTTPIPRSPTAPLALPTVTPAAPTATVAPPTATPRPSPATPTRPVTATQPPATPPPTETAVPAPAPTTPPAPTAPPSPTAPPEPTATAVLARAGRVDLPASAFSGGFRNAGGSPYADRTGEERPATWIYGGQSDYPAMTARFQVDQPPRGGAQLTLVGMDAEGPDRMPIQVTLNDRVIAQGPNRLADWRWSQEIIGIPPGLLRDGENTLTIRSLSPQANFNAPPFFMLSEAHLAWER